MSDYNYFIFVGNAFNDSDHGWLSIRGPKLDPTSTQDGPAFRDPEFERANDVCKANPCDTRGGFLITGYTTNAQETSQSLYIARTVPDFTSNRDNRVQFSRLVIATSITGRAGNQREYEGECLSIVVLWLPGAGRKDTDGNGDIYLTRWEPHSSKFGRNDQLILSAA